jgi:hypothetical protein
VTLKGQVQLNNERDEQRIIEDNAVIEEKSGD